MKTYIMAVVLFLTPVLATNLNAGMYSWTDENGVRHYGNVSVSEDAENVKETEEAKTPKPKPKASATNSVNQDGLKQIEALRQQMLADPEIMKLIQSLMANPEFMKKVQDPKVLEAYNKGDITALMTNPELLKLLTDPTVQAISQKIQKKQNNTTSTPKKATP